MRRVRQRARTRAAEASRPLRHRPPRPSRTNLHPRPPHTDRMRRTVRTTGRCVLLAAILAFTVALGGILRLTIGMAAWTWTSVNASIRMQFPDTVGNAASVRGAGTPSFAHYRPCSLHGVGSEWVPSNATWLAAVVQLPPPVCFDVPVTNDLDVPIAFPVWDWTMSEPCSALEPVHQRGFAMAYIRSVPSYRFIRITDPRPSDASSVLPFFVRWLLPFHTWMYGPEGDTKWGVAHRVGASVARFITATSIFTIDFVLDCAAAAGIFNGCGRDVDVYMKQTPKDRPERGGDGGGSGDTPVAGRTRSHDAKRRRRGDGDDGDEHRRGREERGGGGGGGAGAGGGGGAGDGGDGGGDGSDSEMDGAESPTGHFFKAHRPYDDGIVIQDYPDAHTRDQLINRCDESGDPHFGVFGLEHPERRYVCSNCGVSLPAVLAVLVHDGWCCSSKDVCRNAQTHLFRGLESVSDFMMYLRSSVFTKFGVVHNNWLSPLIRVAGVRMPGVGRLRHILGYTGQLMALEGSVTFGVRAGEDGGCSFFGYDVSTAGRGKKNKAFYQQAANTYDIPQRVVGAHHPVLRAASEDDEATGGTAEGERVALVRTAAATGVEAPRSLIRAVTATEDGEQVQSFELKGSVVREMSGIHGVERGARRIAGLYPIYGDRSDPRSQEEKRDQPVSWVGVKPESSLLEALGYPIFFPKGVFTWGSQHVLASETERVYDEAPDWIRQKFLAGRGVHDIATGSTTHGWSSLSYARWRAAQLNDAGIGGQAVHQLIIDLVKRYEDGELRAYRSTRKDADVVGVPKHIRGSPAELNEGFLVASRMSAMFGPPVAMLTVSAEVDVPEVTTQLPSGHTWKDHPELVVAMHTLRVKQLLRWLQSDASPLPFRVDHYFCRREYQVRRRVRRLASFNASSRPIPVLRSSHSPTATWLAAHARPHLQHQRTRRDRRHQQRPGSDRHTEGAPGRRTVRCVDLQQHHAIRRRLRAPRAADAVPPTLLPRFVLQGARRQVQVPPRPWSRANALVCQREERHRHPEAERGLTGHDGTQRGASERVQGPDPHPHPPWCRRRAVLHEVHRECGCVAVDIVCRS